MRDVLVYLAGVTWDDVRGTDRHLVEHLSRFHDVLWVDPPLSVVRPAIAGDLRRLRHLAEVSDAAPGVGRVSLLVPPFPTRRRVQAMAEKVAARGLRTVMRREKRAVIGTVNSNPQLSFELVPGRAPRLYYATDAFVFGAALMGVSERVLATAEARRVAEADILVGVSPLIVERWEAGDRPVHVLPNGCDVMAYAGIDQAPFPADVSLTGPIAGMVGQISSRIDLPLLEAVADTGLALLIVGPLVRTTDRRRFDELTARPNVQWVGPKPFDELPSYLRVVDVGLTPYAQTDFNRASFPLKTLEYLAAGLPVVSSPLPAVDALGTDLVHSAAGPEEFARIVRRLADQEPDAVQVERRRAFAARHSWDQRAIDLLDLFGIPVG